MPGDKLVVKVLSQNEQDTADLARRLREHLGDATVELVTKRASDLAGRGSDPAVVMQVIELALSAVGTVAVVVQALNSFKSEQRELIIANLTTGCSVRIRGSDPAPIVKAKVARVAKGRSLFGRLFHWFQNDAGERSVHS